MSDESVWDESSPGQPESAPARSGLLRTLKSTSTRRALLLTALGGLLIAGLTTALPLSRESAGRASSAASSPGASSSPTAVARTDSTFDTAAAGDCLNWPDKSPDAATVVDCKDEHRFEVADSVDMSTFPGSEYSPDAAPPSPARIQQISQEHCQVAVQQYLGPKFDPNSRFVVSMLWSGENAWKIAGQRHILCGVQLPGPDNQQMPFTGKVADLDQSKVWPAGTCVGIDPASNQPTDIPVDCASPHAMEITGSVNLAEKFPGALPAEQDQDAFIKDTCTRMTDAYLAPIQLRNTTLTLIYSTASLPSWSAGSRQVACSVGATLGNGGWATLLNSAKGPLLINGQPPVPPPDLPPERLDLSPIPMPDLRSSPPSTRYPSSGSSSGRSPSGSPSIEVDPSQRTLHMPNQPPPPPEVSHGGPVNPPPPEAPPLDSLPHDVPPPAPDAPAFGAPPGPAAPAPPA